MIGSAFAARKGVRHSLERLPRTPNDRARRSLPRELDADARAPRDRREEHPDPMLGEILVDRLARPLPVEIVVEKEDAPGREARVEMDQLVARRRVPVGVEAKERDALRRGPGERLLDLSLHEAELLARV